MADDNEESDDKPYEASQKKLQDARAKGNVPRSSDLNTTAAYGGLVIASMIWGADMMTRFGSALVGFLSGALWQSTEMREGGTVAILSGQTVAAIWAIMPLFLLPFILVLASIAGQKSMIFHGGNIKAKLSRLSILSNAKKKFGRRGLFEFFKSFLKLVLFSSALIFFVMSREPDIIQSAMLSTPQVLMLLAELGIGFFLVALGISLVLGVLDYVFQRAEHFRTLRMTHKEMMDELKNFEGDPAMKQRRRQRGMEIARSQMLNDMKEADVVIVNPEHYAVALSWSREPGTAPTCVAKGVDEMAATIRELAATNGIPIYREPPTARALYATAEIGDEIAPEYYGPVAAAIRFAEEMRSKQKNRPYGSD